MIPGRATGILLLGSLVLLGCAPGMPIKTDFDADEYARFEADGSGSISGTALVRGVSGNAKPGALRPVYLDPVTSYSTEWFEKMVRWYGRVRFRPLHPGFAAHRRETVADLDGRFRFDRLPAGDYFLTCDMWKSYAVVEVGGFGFARIALREGEQLEDVSLAVGRR